MKVYYALCFFILGTILASFYDVVATRLPIGKSIVKPKSHCEHCNHSLKWYELIPIISFLILKGRCSSCHKKISRETIIVEISLGILFCYSYLKFGFSYSLWISLILSSLVLIIFISDIKYMIILDSPLVIGSILVIILKWVYFGFNKMLISILSGISLFLFMFLIGKLGNKMFHRESLGGGDMKLSFVMGLVLNLPLGLTSLVLSTFLALPYATFSMFTHEEHEVAFGPFLISAAFIVFLFSSKFELLLQLLIPL